MRFLLIATFGVLVGCGPLTPLPRDAGVDAGASGGGAATGGGGGVSGGGSGGGSATGGGGGGGGGGGVTGGGTTGGGGGASAFSWVRMTFSPAPTNPATTFTVRGLTRRASGEVFVTLNNGELYASAAGSETLVRVPNLPAQTGSTLLGPVIAFGTDVALMRGASVQTCSGTCTDFASFNPLQSLAFPEEGTAFCARSDGSTAYLTSNAGSTGKLWTLSRGMTLTMTETSANVGIGNVEKCQVAASGEVFIAGDSSVGVLRTSGGLATESIDLMGQPGASWRDVSGGFLVGGGSGYRVATRNAGTWTSAMPDTSGTLFTSVAALSANETLAGGILNSGNTTQAGILKWNGSRFVALTPAAPVFEVELGVMVSENEVYFAGYERSSGGYVVVHGTR